MYPGNYQSFDGFMFPMSMEIKTEGTDQSQKASFTKVETDVDVDDSIFKMPETK
jgi:outer membrane lipoprotein-sorting protein